MSRQQRGGFWGNLFGTAPTHDRFSVDELQYLHGILLKNPVITDANRDTVVEALRSIAELVIWGDQHDSGMVEYFLTENLLGHFNQILQQRSNRRGNVAMQVLQTLSILIQNLRNQQTVYYLFSNNHINEIVSMRFDFDDDEVLGYFVNLLKTISLKLNEVTVQFFFQAGGTAGGSGGRSPGSPGRPASFPLYSEAVKFVNHRDPMVRTAVKTLTLNVYAIPLPAVHGFVTSRPASAYFVELASYIAEQCRVLDRLLSSWDVASPGAQVSVEGCLAEVEDLLSYCNDVLMTGVAPLRELLLDCLWQAFVGPVLFWPLIQEDVAVQHIAALSLASGGTPGSGEAARAVQRGCVGPLCSLYVFERLFLAITDQELLAQLLSALLGGSAAGGSCSSSPSSSRPASPDQQQRAAVATAATAATAAGPSKWQLPPALLIKLQYSPAAYRQALLGMLRGTDAQGAAAAVRVLASLLQSRAVGEEELEMVGLLPLRRRKQRQLMQVLVGDSPASSLLLEAAAGAAGTAAPAGQTRPQGDCSALAPAAAQQSSSSSNSTAAQADDSMLTCNGTAKPTGCSSNDSSLGSGGSIGANHVHLILAPAADGSMAVQLQLGPEQQQQQQQQQQRQRRKRLQSDSRAGAAGSHAYCLAGAARPPAARQQKVSVARFRQLAAG
jgi:protein CLEC16A